MAELLNPNIDFSSLGQLPTIYKQARNEQGVRDALAGGIGNDPQSLSALAANIGQYNPQMGMTLAGLAHTYGREATTDARQTAQDVESKRRFGLTYGLQSAAEKRAAADFENTPDQYVKNPNFGQPGQSEYTDRYAQATAAAGSGKPIPYETIAGTRFLMPQPGGGYSNVDPNTIGKSAPVPSSAKVVGDAEGVASGLYDQPSAPGQRPPVQGQSSGFADRFKGEPAAPADPMAVDPKTGRREGFLSTIGGPDIQSYIKKIADYEIDPRTTSIKGGKREQILSAVAQYDPTYDQNIFSSRAKAIKDFSTGKQGDIVRSFDVAIDHLDTLKGAADALKNGDSRALNSLRNRWREQTGSELPTNFKALVPIVSGEIAKAVVGSQNALADREELRAGLQASASPDQLGGVITGYKALMAGQLKGLRKQYEDTTGKKNFDSRVRESTKKAILNDEAGGKEKGPVKIDGYTITEH